MVGGGAAGGVPVPVRGPVVLHRPGHHARRDPECDRPVGVRLAGAGRTVLPIRALPGRRVPDPDPPELLPYLPPRAWTRRGARALRAPGQERRLHDLLRLPGVLHRVLRGPDARAAQAHRAGLGGTVRRAHGGRGGLDPGAGFPRSSHLGGALQVRGPQLLRAHDEPDPVDRAGRLLHPGRPDTGAEPPAARGHVRAIRAHTEDPGPGAVAPGGGRALLRALGRRVRGVWRRIRFRLEKPWRVEAAELIDSLPLFEEVPVEVLNDLAGRVRLRSIEPGQPVVRQGDRPDAFYVVRHGLLEVIEENPERGTERTLGTLGRGESFGELGLLERGPRTATVRAAESSEVFQVDKGTFDQLLADMADVPDFAPTLQAAAELRSLAPFAHLDPAGISELLEHGSWLMIPAGETVVREGEIGDAFYAIESGQVEGGRGGERVRRLGPGGFSGGVAFLLAGPGTARVGAVTAVRAFRLDREGFDRLVGDAFRRGTLNPHVVESREQRH